MYDSGLKVVEIAEYFGISKRMVFHDLRKAKELNQLVVSDIEQGEILGREIQFLNNLRRKSMRDYMLCQNNESAKIGYLRTAIATHEKLIKLLQDHGLTTKVPERISWEGDISLGDDEVRKKYVEFLIWAKKKLEAGEKLPGDPGQ